MAEMKYKYGVRVEKAANIYVGLGFTWFTETALVVSLLRWDIYIGKVYDLGS